MKGIKALMGGALTHTHKLSPGEHRRQKRHTEDIVWGVEEKSVREREMKAKT